MNEIVNVKSQLKISLPIAFENLIYILMTVVDTLVISLIGTKELTALGAMVVILNIMQMSIQTINVSCSTLVAKSLGKNDLYESKLIIGNSIILTFFISIITIILVSCVQPIFPNLFNVDKIAISYLGLRLLGFVQSSLVTILSGYQRTIGNQKKVMYLRIVAILLNLVLDIIAVKIGYGINGIALITVFIDTLLAIYLVTYSKNKIKIKFIDEHFKNLIKLFKWNFVERFVSITDNLIFNLIVARIGILEYSVHVILIQIINIYESFIQGFGDGITISVGIANGKKEQEYMLKVATVAKKSIKYLSLILPSIFLIIAIIIMNISLREFELQKIFFKVIPLCLFSCYVITSATYYFSILRGLRKFKFLAKRNIISSIIKILVSTILSFSTLGIVGVWVGYLMYGISQKHLSKKKYKELNLNI